VFANALPQYAIRPTIRHHSTLKRDMVINQVAALINNERHKVDLKKPDKVILIDIFRVRLLHDCLHLRDILTRSKKATCGMSVVDGDWEQLRKYNLSELYGEGQHKDAAMKTAEAEADVKAKEMPEESQMGADRETKRRAEDE
jgi:tRNA acetyltransferase TAN1